MPADISDIASRVSEAARHPIDNSMSAEQSYYASRQRSVIAKGGLSDRVSHPGVVPEKPESAFIDDPSMSSEKYYRERKVPAAIVLHEKTGQPVTVKYGEIYVVKASQINDGLASAVAVGGIVTVKIKESLFVQVQTALDLMVSQGRIQFAQSQLLKLETLPPEPVTAAATAPVLPVDVAPPAPAVLPTHEMPPADGAPAVIEKPENDVDPQFAGADSKPAPAKQTRSKTQSRREVAQGRGQRTPAAYAAAAPKPEENEFEA